MANGGAADITGSLSIRHFRYLAIRFTIAELGVMAPVSFGERERFSSQRVNIMRADVPRLTFRPVGG